MLAIIGGVAYGAYWSISTVRASFPQTKGSITLEGLSGPVDVKRDGYGIPQIYASSDEDLFLAQGYVQAQDRFYEMDVRRHMTSGAVGDVRQEPGRQRRVPAHPRLGPGGEGGVRQDAVGLHEEVPPATPRGSTPTSGQGRRGHLPGVRGPGLHNDYKPQKWTPVDSVAWLKAMAWDLRGNMQDEIDRALMTSRLGPKQIADLYPEYPYSRNKAIVQEGQYDAATQTFGRGGTCRRARSRRPRARPEPRASTPRPSEPAEGLYKVLDDLPTAVGVNGNGIGSNSWVVAGVHHHRQAAAGQRPAPVASLLSVWYQMGLHCRTVSSKCQYDVSGYTFAGMPGVIIGHNGTSPGA